MESIRLKCVECEFNGFAPEEQDGYETVVYAGVCPMCGCDDVFMTVEKNGTYRLAGAKPNEETET